MKIYKPKNNLGCLGIEIGNLYFDFFEYDKFPYFRIFFNLRGKARGYITICPFLLTMETGKGRLIVSKYNRKRIKPKPIIWYKKHSW